MRIWPGKTAVSNAAPAGHGQSKAMLVVLGILWGLNWPAVKVALSGVSPWALRSIGLGAATCAVFALGLLRRRPLECGVLNGFLRADLIEQEVAREERLTSEDLKGDVFLGNSLRGLIPARPA